MGDDDPVGALGGRFSSPGATPASWADVLHELAVAGGLEAKYGPHVRAPDGTWAGMGDAIRGGDVLAFRVPPSAVFAFGRGAVFSQTRWTFDR